MYASSHACMHVCVCKYVYVYIYIISLRGGRPIGGLVTLWFVQDMFQIVLGFA